MAVVTVNSDFWHKNGQKQNRTYHFRCESSVFSHQKEATFTSKVSYFWVETPQHLLQDASNAYAQRLLRTGDVYQRSPVDYPYISCQLFPTRCIYRRWTGDLWEMFKQHLTCLASFIYRDSERFTGDVALFWQNSMQKIRLHINLLRSVYLFSINKGMPSITCSKAFYHCN